VVRAARSEIKVLNPVGSTVYALLDGAHSRDDIARAVAEEYEVPLEQARADVDRFLAELEDEGMLHDVAPAGRRNESPGDGQ
jgi:hypothetical protein